MTAVPKTTKSPTLEAAAELLARAEKKLAIDGLFIGLQSDGSGSVRNFANQYVCLFDNLGGLLAWLRNPRVIRYDEEGAEVG